MDGIGGVGGVPTMKFAPAMGAVGLGALFQLAREDDSTLSGEGTVSYIVAALRLFRRGLAAVATELATSEAVAGR